MIKFCIKVGGGEEENIYECFKNLKVRSKCIFFIFLREGFALVARGKKIHRGCNMDF